MARAITQLEPHVNAKLVVDFHESVRGATIEDLFKMAIEEFGLKSKLEDLLQLDANIQMKEFPRMKLFDGVVDILKFLKESGKTLHVCTNRTMKTLEPILQGHVIKEYFEKSFPARTLVTKTQPQMLAGYCFTLRWRQKRFYLFW